jgi:hypothetical protein
MPETDIQINLDDSVIGDPSVIVAAQDGILNLGVEYEYLVELVTQQVGLFTIHNGLLKFMRSKLVLHEWQVVVEVTTNEDSRKLVLSYYVTNDLCHSLSSLLLVSLFASFKIARDQVNLTSFIGELHLGPVHV